MKRNRLWMAVGLGLSLWMAGDGLLPRVAQAQDEGTEADEATTLEGIQVVGSRRVGRSATETPVPIDVIPMEKAAEQGAQFDLMQSLQYTAPSYYSTRQTGADGADLVDSASLRGLGSDQTLVLLNGKRRHTTSLVNIFGARNRGNTGTDLSTIPLLAVERVEILRDGAAAQYGSDAIAGVMNIALKKSRGCDAVLGYGEYTEGDGENQLASAYCGFGFGSDGVLAVTGEWMDRGRSDRSEPEDNPRTIGDSAVENQTVFLNGETPIGEDATVYFTLGAQNRDASSAAFARGGIGSDDIPSRNSEAMYPDGFVPFINGDIEDRSAILGVWWNFGEWRTDLSTTYGSNEFIYDISNTLNASIANLDLLNGGPGRSASSFDAGGFQFQQNTTNLDFTRFYDGVYNGLNLAFGAEFRTENYEIFAGELGSYVDADGVGEGGNAGSQGFPGFQPADEVDADRDSWAVYGDVEIDFSEAVTSSFALRFEEYDDFGSTLDGKIALAYRATDSTTIRGSISTGFRAPSLQQAYFSSTFTDFISGEPLDVVLAPNGGVIATAAGIPALTEETSTGATVGFTWAPTDALSLTLDAYRIEIDDRIVLSGRFGIDDPTIGEILQELGVGQAQFFVNSVDTRTSGVDLTLSHDRQFDNGGSVETFLGVSYADTDVTGINAPAALAGREDVLLEPRERLFIEEGVPSLKAILGFDFSFGDWNPVVKFIHFGRQELGTFSGPPVPNQKYQEKTSADMSLTYSFNEHTKLTVGGANVFNAKPTRQDPNETDNGHVYESVQFGLNGAAWFVRLAHTF